MKGSDSNVDERGARAETIDRAIGEVRGRARAEDRTMAIEVDAWGHITQIKLSPHALSDGTERLESEIIRQYRLARVDAETQAQQVYEDILREEKAAATVRRDRIDDDDPQPVRISSTLYS
ncbi:hypothetical protein IU501_17170 [Nocardia otitidiscaviarum]|nr:hypothetical protein [Nocardia otitidiscaviarum]MBF6134728.1 hypothetical protein [Nocardia otitidiscaviarum]